jgi:hypothetical protein
MSNRKIRNLRKQSGQKYGWAKGRSFGVSADVAGAELDRIREINGELQSRDVVDAARPDDAPLHPAFEWDDWKAAENYRRHQAGTMIRALIVLPENSETETSPHRAYFRATASPEVPPSYVPAVELVQSPELFADAARRLSAELENARKSADELESIAKQMSIEPERMARIGLAMRALEAAGAAVAALH